MRVATLRLFLSALFLAGASAAMASETNPQCSRDATTQAQLCKAGCRDDFLTAKDMCRNINHDCADLCRASREDCVSGPLDSLETCVDDCDASLESAKEICRQQFAPDTPERDQCIDDAQVTAFQCRDACREGVIKALRQCRVTFRVCIQACPHASN